MLGDTSTSILEYAALPGFALLAVIPGGVSIMNTTKSTFCGGITDSSAKGDCDTRAGVVLSVVITAGMAWLAYKLFMRGK